MASILIRGGLVMRDARTPPTFESILVTDGTITDFLPAEAEVADAQLYDASDKLIHPGLVNAHAHGHTPLTKGVAERWSLELLLASGPSIYGERGDREKYLSTLLNAAELALKGCTAVYDMCMEVPLPTPHGVQAMAQAYADVGMRAVMAPMLADISFWRAIPGLEAALPPDLARKLNLDVPGHEIVLSAMQQILDTWPGYDGIVPAIGPTIPLHGSDALWTGSRDMARVHGLSMQSHLQESKVQALSGRKRYGRSLTAYLRSLDVLGPHFVGAHGVWLDRDDMRLLGEAGASVSHNPGSNMILGSGLADVRAMLECGVNVGLGTDGSNCADNLNMYESMRTALRVSHVRTPDIDTWLSAPEVFHMATVGSARALGMPDLGRLAVGHPADLVLLDLGHVNWIPTNDVVTQLVQGEDGNAVDSVMINGRWVVRDRQLVNIVIRELRQEVQDVLSDIRTRTVDHRATFQAIGPALRCFCPAMMREPYSVERFGAGCSRP